MPADRRKTREIWITELPFPPEPEVDMAVAEKVARGVAKGAFTRSKNALTSLITREAEDSEILAARNHMVECYFTFMNTSINNKPTFLESYISSLNFLSKGFDSVCCTLQQLCSTFSALYIT